LSIDPRAQDVLDVWFGAAGSPEFGTERKTWWKKKRSFDAMLAERFGALLDEAQAGGLRDWERSPLGTLGTRNVPRLSRVSGGSPGSHSSRAASGQAIASGSATIGRSCPAQRPASRTSSRSVWTRGPPSS
jgi:hypothetical protein